MNFAIIKLQGHQEIVNAETQNLVVDLIDKKAGEKISPVVLLTSIDEKVEIGTPNVDFPIELEIVEHKRGDKIYVSKFHAKSRFRKRIGFRAEQTVLKVVKFGNFVEKKATAKVEKAVKEKDTTKVPAKKKTSVVKKTAKKV